jgi:hypothetical protein
VAKRPTPVRINELTPQGQAACSIAVRMLEAAGAEAWDVDGRQGAVNAMLTLKDGARTAAFETNLAAEGALEIASLLARDNHKWPLPGLRWPTSAARGRGSRCGSATAGQMGSAVPVAAQGGDFTGDGVGGSGWVGDGGAADDGADEEQHRADLQQPFEAGIR